MRWVARITVIIKIHEWRTIDVFQNVSLLLFWGWAWGELSPWPPLLFFPIIVIISFLLLSFPCYNSFWMDNESPTPWIEVIMMTQMLTKTGRSASVCLSYLFCFCHLKSLFLSLIVMIKCLTYSVNIASGRRHMRHVSLTHLTVLLFISASSLSLDGKEWEWLLPLPS